jgi:hypothetical protein
VQIEASPCGASLANVPSGGPGGISFFGNGKREGKETGGRKWKSTRNPVSGKDGKDSVSLGWSIVVYGLVLSIALSAPIVGTLYANPRLLLRSYPPGIKRAAGPQTGAEKKKTRIVGFFFLLLLIGVPAVSTWLLERSRGGEIDYAEAFLNIFGILAVFNAVDLLLIDWLLFCAVTPRFLVIRGTEGMAEYKDYLFHLKGFAVGIMLAATAGAALAAVFALVQAGKKAVPAARHSLFLVRPAWASSLR